MGLTKRIIVLVLVFCLVVTNIFWIIRDFQTSFRKDQIIQTSAYNLDHTIELLSENINNLNDLHDQLLIRHNTTVTENILLTNTIKSLLKSIEDYDCLNNLLLKQNNEIVLENAKLLNYVQEINETIAKSASQ